MGVRAEGPGGGSHARIRADRDEFSSARRSQGWVEAIKAPLAGAEEEKAWDFR